MSIKQNFLSMIVAVMVLMSALFCTFPAYADSENYAAEGLQCFDFLKAAGVIPETDTYSADSIVTRGQFVHLSIGLSGVNPGSLASEDYVFSDVTSSHPYAKEIAYARKLGCISGSSSDLFNPDIPVTGEQAAKILCDILGYSHIATSYGGYPGGYIRTAASIGIFDGTAMGNAKELTMADAVTMISNAANAEVMKIASIGDTIEYETIEDYTILEERLGIKFAEGIVTANECTDLYAPDSGLGSGNVAVDNLIFGVGDTDVAEFVGYLVKIYYKDSGGRYPEVIHYSVSEENKVISCNADALETDDGYLTYEADENTVKKIKVRSDASYIVNGKMTSFRYSALTEIEKGTVDFISNNGDNIMDVVCVSSYETYVVSGVSVVNNGIATEDGSFIELDPGSEEYIFEIIKDGNRTSLSGIVPGNVVLLACSTGDGVNKKKVLVSDKAISGKLNETGNETAVIDGVEYKISQSLSEEINIGKQYEFLVDYFGEIVRVCNLQSSVYGYLYGLTTNKFGEVRCKIYSENKHWVELDFKNKLEFNGNTVSEKEVYEDIEFNMGKYRDIIRYNVNSDNEVIRMETALDMTEFSLVSDEAYDASENNIFRKSYAGEQVWRSRSNSFEGKICVNSNSVVFYIPEGGNEDEIRVLKPGALPSDDLYDFVAYDVDKNLNASVIKVSKLPLGGGSSSSFFFVKGRSEAIDSEGDTVPSLRGYWRGFEISVQVELSSTLTEENLKALNIGDPILFSLNEDGKIVKINNCAPDSDGYYAGPAGRGAYYTSSCQAGGRVLRNDYINGHLVVQSSNKGDYYNTQYGSETIVFIFDKKTGEYSEGTVADILPGDIIVSKLMYFFSNEIAVIRE